MTSVPKSETISVFKIGPALKIANFFAKFFAIFLAINFAKIFADENLHKNLHIFFVREPPNEIGNMPLLSDEIISFVVGCNFT